VRRQVVEQTDALRRWDKVYQCLLSWDIPNQSENLTTSQSEQTGSNFDTFPITTREGGRV
jgi:hypothetical protein